MEITWYGHSCFRISERGKSTVVTDPYDHTEIGLQPIKLKSEIVTVSCDLPGHNYVKAVKGEPTAITGPGEYEIGSVFITGVQTNGKKLGDGDIRNTLYVLDFDGITVAHLGEMNRVPSQTEVEALGTVNIALVPVGGQTSLSAAKAAEVISLIEPNIVIPMHYDLPGCLPKLDSISKFLKEMGLNQVETLDVYKVGSASSLPDETRVVVLDVRTS